MRIFTRRGVRVAIPFAFLLILFLMCGTYLLPPLPFPCANFTETYWSEFNFNVDTPDEVASNVFRLWGIENSKLDRYEDIWGNLIGLRWLSIRLNKPFGFYTAWFREGVLQKIDVEWTPLPMPSLSQAVECLGAPGYYIVYYGMAPDGHNINLDLLYTEKGLVVRYVSLFTTFLMPELPEEFHPRMRIEGLAVVAPGAPEQMVPAVYSTGNVGGGYVHNACLSKPWPGSIEAMEIVPRQEFISCH